MRSACLLFSVMLTLGGNVYADTVTGNGSFQTWNTGVLGTAASPTTGGPYWNNVSGEGAARNIGWCLAGGGNCAISNPPGALSYYGNGTAAPSDMGFVSSGSVEAVTLAGAFTNQNGSVNGTDYFGWYQLNPNGTLAGMHQLFSANDAIGSTMTFAPTGNYGFYILNVQSANQPYAAGYYWFMNSSLDYVTGTGLLDAGVQHFGVFSQSNGSFFVSGEDTPGPNSDFDYNDMIVQVQSVPEPASIALFAGGLCLVGWKLRRARV